MDAGEITEVINLLPTADFLSGKELVSLRKPEELTSQMNIGHKFSECKKTEAEKEAVDCALDSQKAILSQKRGARICDLMQAEWNEELNVSFATKLKGKFVQHMGHKMDDKIALTPEESLFLLENGCLEIMNGKAPMSTEEAYAALLKQKLSVEKYIIYSYLSQLGFIVVPHQKELKNRSQSKVTTAERNKKKRKNQSPLPEENKRLTFSGAFSEETDNNSKVEEESKSLLNDIAIISKGLVSPSESELKSEESKKMNADSDDQLEPNHRKIIPSSTCDSLDNSKADDEMEIDVEEDHSLSSEKFPELVVDESSSVKPSQLVVNDSSHVKPTELVVRESSPVKSTELVVSESSPVKPSELVVNESSSVKPDLIVDVSSSVKPSLSASAVDIDVDSQSTDVLFDSLEKTTGVFVADTEEGTNIDACTQSSDSQCAVINDTSDTDEQNSEVLSCSSYDYNELENSAGENTSENLIVDDEITLVEITKKETTPLAVIDLLSDEEAEMETEAQHAEGDSESDDDIKIIEVRLQNGSGSLNKNVGTPLNLNKIKSQKTEDCKTEQSNIHSIHDTTPRIQFPELFRKDLVCVARPYANLLPLHVQPNKEVYILDCSKLEQSSRGCNQSAAAPQPQGRLWNSYRDLQDYQRSLRRNRPFPRYQNQDRSWQRGYRHHEGGAYRRPPYHHNNNQKSRDRRNELVRPDRNPPNNRHSDSMDYHDHNTLRNQNNGTDYHGHNGSEDQKPFISSRSPALLGDRPGPNPGDSYPLRVPQFSNPNSLPTRLRTPNFPLGNPPLNPIEPPFNPPGGLPDMQNLSSQEFVAEVHRTAYSYATTMLSSMFGSAFNANTFSPLAPFPTIRHGPPFGMPQPITLVDGTNSRNLSSPFANEYYPLPNNRQLRGDFPRHRRHHSTEPFPCHYRNIQNKKSWNDVTAAVRGEQSDSESSDIEEIPINLNEFLWNASNICPLVKPGIKHPLADVLSPLKLTQLAKMTDKACKNEKYFSDTKSMEISFDVYKPGTHFKKSCPGTPNLRIIVMRASDPVPRYSEIAFLQRKWSDGAAFQIAIVDNADVSFYSFSNISIPSIVPFQD